MLLEKGSPELSKSFPATATDPLPESTAFVLSARMAALLAMEIVPPRRAPCPRTVVPPER